MRFMDHLVAATGLGSASAAVVDSASHLARLTGARVHLAYSVPPMDSLPALGGRVQGEAEAHLRRLVTDLERRAVEAEAHVEQGVPGPAVCAVASRVDADLLVVGSREAGRLGTVAEHCVQRAPCSVWVARPGARVPGTVVAGIEPGESARFALETAVHLARRAGARLALVHAVQPLSSWLGGLSGLLPQGAEGERLAAARRQVSDLLQGVDLGGVAWELVVSTGRPHEELLAAADRLRADVVVVGARSHKPLGLAGDTARRVATGARGAVLVVRQRAALSLRLDEAADVAERVRRGRELLEVGQAWEALQVLRLAVSEAPTLIPAWHALALAQRALDRVAEAEVSEARIRELYRATWTRTVEADVRRLQGMGGARRRPALDAD